MACGDYPTNELMEAVQAGAFRDVLTCPFIGAVGEWVWPLVTIGALMAGVVVYTRSPVPAVMLGILGAGFVVATLPSGASAIVAGGTAIVIAGVMTVLIIRLIQISRS